MEDYRIRVRIFIGIVLVLLSILGGRLAQLQLLAEDEYSDESRNNAIREQRVQPARGAIFDRNGTLMVSNAPSYNIMITPRYFDEENIPLLADLMEVPDSLVIAKVTQAKARSAFQPYRSFKEVPFPIFSRVQENQFRLPGVTYEILEKRSYVTDATASHALGYIREINDRELTSRKEEAVRTGDDAMYRQGDLVGKTGVEREYEKYLRGQPGSEFRLVNVHGREIKAYQEGKEDRLPGSGYDMYLNIDSKVQALAESLFVNKRGGVVAIDPKTGGIITLLSEPDFDPEIFSESVDVKTWDYLNNSPQKPLYNRATMNLMPPGSTWKPFMSLMSLATGHIKPGQTVYCGGGHPLGGGRSLTCMGVHGNMDVVHAIQNSCNTFFFEMMYRCPVDTFKTYANMFGFGEKAPTDIAEQTQGLIPNEQYFYDKISKSAGRKVEQIPPGWTISMGIGQGDMGVTPLQLARYVAAVGSRGTFTSPHLVQKMVNPETGDVVYPDLPAPKQLPIKDEYFDLVKQGMKLVMEAGTGRLAQIPDIPSGGKTGTAQAPGYNRKDHSVFIMFAPFDDPQIALAVQCENAGYGGSCAAPIASLLAELYLKGELPDSPQVKFRMNRALNVSSQPLPEPKKKE